jgi:hypothetical protein
VPQSSPAHILQDPATLSHAISWDKLERVSEAVARHITIAAGAEVADP